MIVLGESTPVKQRGSNDWADPLVAGIFVPLFARIAVVRVVFIDVVGQGLVFPLVNTLVMDPATGVLPEGTILAARHLTFGLVIGSFFVAWTIGAPYVSRISDSIGHRPAILICCSARWLATR